VVPVAKSSVRRLPASRRQIDAKDAVSLGRPFLGRSGEAVESLEHPDIGEAGRLEDADELCFQQSTGDSTRPEIDVSERAVGKDLADDNVRDLRASAWFQHTRDLPDSVRLVWHEVEDAVRDHDVNG
jgi:hypothetical protein